jgi:hypothetical protein
MRGFAIVAVLGVAAWAAAEEVEAPRLPDLRLVSVREGLRDVSPKNDLARAGETDVAKYASAVGIDLQKPEHTLLAAACKDGRLFYVFWKTTANAFGKRAYVIQRIKKTERTWLSLDKAPEEKVTYQVEAFKLIAGQIKRPDQHYGSYSLREAVKREIVKEYEIGFGTAPGLAETPTWPFDSGTLFRMMQPYQDQPGLHPQVTFLASRTWRLEVAFDKAGAWRVASPEFGFDAPKQWPKPEAALPTPDPASKDVVLEAGVGVPGATVGETPRDGVIAALGQPLDDSPAGRDHRVLALPRSLTANLDPAGRLNTLYTRAGFLGRTKEGVAHGTARAEVMAKLGAPKGQKAEDDYWSYPGLAFWFDVEDRVVTIVISRRP